MALALAACAPALQPPEIDWVAVPGGQLLLGSGEAAVSIEVAPFLLARTEVTNAEFRAFVEASGHVTDAERIGDSVVFRYRGEGGAWEITPGATWRSPEGRGSDLTDRWDHPVVHVSIRDAEAYAAWAGARLPTEAEWEWAARAGDRHWPFPWGPDHEPSGAPPANIWQGPFPSRDLAQDGHRGSAPVGSFPLNPFGLHDLAGNVWEYVSDRRGGGPAAGRHPRLSAADEPGLIAQIRGGSFLCARGVCEGYRSDARQFKLEADGSNNVGFRLASGISDPPPRGAGR